MDPKLLVELQILQHVTLPEFHLSLYKIKTILWLAANVKFYAFSLIAGLPICFIPKSIWMSGYRINKEGTQDILKLSNQETR